MNLQRIAVPLLVIGLLAFAARQYSWAGFLAVSGGLMFWLLLHWNRLLTVMRRAADRPKGWVASAVMFNAKLKPGVNLLHVIALTRSLGEKLSEEGESPERYRWTDGGGSSVTASFQGGLLREWALHHPGADTQP